MPVTLGDLKRNTRVAPVAYGEQTINLTYRPSAITPGFGDGDDSKTFLVDTLLKVLIAWDIYEDDAYTVMTPITAAVLNSDSIGLPLLRAMFDAVVLDTLAGKRNGAISGGG